jgi:hypothetical protein
MHSKLKYVTEYVINTSNLYRFLFGTANKKSKLISTNSGFNTAKNLQHRQHNEQLNSNIKKTKASGKVHQQQTGAASVDFEQQLIQDHESLYNGLSGDLKRERGPNLVNKQLVLPIIAFPNSNTNESNHLIKPSEYLKSIVTDKRSSPR